MATISNQSNKNVQDDEQKNVSGPGATTITNPTGSAATGVMGTQQQQQAPSSGRFTNISQYMQANKQAGSQLGQQIGQQVGQQVTKSTQDTQRAQQGLQSGIGQAGQQVQQLGTYTQNLSQTQPQGETTKQVGPGYLASGYEANLGNRAAYAQQLAANQDELKKFLDFRSGTIAQQQQDELRKQQEKAQQATQSTQDLLAERQKQLQFGRDRGALLQDVVKSNRYGLGQRSLDNAFLQMDKNKSLQGLRQDLSQRQQQFNTANLLPQLQQQVGDVTKGLQEGTQALQKQTTQNVADLTSDVQSREKLMADARMQRLKDLQSQYQALQSGEGISKDFADMLGLKESDVLFRTLDDRQLGSFLDTTGLQAMPTSLTDLANQRDVELMDVFARLAQTNPALVQASQLGDAKSTDILRKELDDRMKRFTEEDAKREYQARNTQTTGEKWRWTPFGTFREHGGGSVTATAYGNLGDYLNSGQFDTATRQTAIRGHTDAEADRAAYNTATQQLNEILNNLVSEYGLQNRVRIK